MEWIKCSDRMPPLGECGYPFTDELLIVGENHQPMIVAKFSYCSFTWLDDGAEPIHDMYIPTHWMPLPQPPKD